MERIGYSEEIRSAVERNNEDNSCTVIAWTNCFDCSYEKARAWLSKFGRKPRRGMLRKDLIRALESCEVAKIKVGPYDTKNKITLNQFTKKHPVGRYYVCVRGHALCVKDGVVYDYCDKPRRQVQLACRVYLEGEI